jgi:hypothetical protein
MHYVAKPNLEIDGKEASDDLMEDILQISVEESLHLPGMFTIVIQNAYSPGRKEDKPWKHQDLFAIGKPIKIGFSSSTTASHEFEQEEKGYVLEGEITAMETHFTSGSQAPVIIRGYDVSHRLHRGRYNRSFQNMKDSDIVKKIAEEVGIPKGKLMKRVGLMAMVISMVPMATCFKIIRPICNSFGNGQLTMALNSLFRMAS